MNKSFVLLDKNNNLQKTANIIVKFNFEGKDYLVYSIDENEQNCQIFVSKVILNSEGKYFIDSILPEEKNKLNNIVYNIVIVIPTEAKKGVSFDVLAKNIFDKFSVKLSYSIAIMEIQEYYSSCSVAITSKLLVDVAVNFYDKNLSTNEQKVVSELPTWTAPVEVTAPTSIDVNISNTSENLASVTMVQPEENVISNSLNLQSAPVLESALPNEMLKSVPTTEVNITSSSEPVPTTIIPEDTLPNPQVQKLAIISDPSIGLGVTNSNHQSDIVENKKAGFANTKYVVIGTACLILAVAVVITAYILISNMK